MAATLQGPVAQCRLPHLEKERSSWTTRPPPRRSRRRSLHYPLAVPGRDYNPAGVHPGSSVEIMRNWLKNNGAAVYGTKQQMYARVLERNKQLLHEELIDNEMKRQLEERRKGQPLMPVVPLPAPKQPMQVEREEH